MPVSAQSSVVSEAPITIQQSLLFDLPPTANPLHSAYVHSQTHTTGVGSAAGATATNLSKRRNGSPSDALHGNWPAVLAALAARRGPDTIRSNWKPAVHTSKLLQRQIALQVIGWSLRDDELNEAIKRWQKEGQFARAACWLVFTRQYGKAVELLIRSDGRSKFPP
jgi:hypothetical protein